MLRVQTVFYLLVAVTFGVIFIRAGIGPATTENALYLLGSMLGLTLEAVILYHHLRGENPN